MINPNEIRHWLIVAWFGLLLLISQSTAHAQVLSAASQSLPGTALGSTAWGDYDGDGDPDLLMVGLTGPADGCAPLSQIFRNSDFASINAPLIGISMGQAVWGDYDGDGDLDLALAGFTAENEGTVRIYKNENGAFVLDSDQDFVPLRYCALAWGDYDADGDLDLLVSGMSVGGNPRTVLYRNARIDRTRLGSPLGGRSVLQEDVPNTGRLINLNQGNMAWGDVDNDGDLDLALTGYGTGGPRQSQIYLNNPTGTLTQDDRNTDLTPVSNGDLAWGDYDNDGDLDLILSGWNKEWQATLNLYTNSAGILRENTTFSSTRIIGSVGWGDYDNDGDLDLAASGQNSASDRFAFVLRNGPTGTFQTDNTQNINGLRGGDLAWVDIDTDGDLDLVLSGEDATGIRKTVIYTSAGTKTVNTAPQPPNRLGTPVVTSNGVSLNWNDGTDSQSNASGLTYTLRIGTSPGSHNVFSGASPVGPGNLGASKTVELTIPLARDTYYWSVRAIDGGGLVSVESQEDLFRVQDLVSSVQHVRSLQSSAMAWGDYDNDGDLDLAISGRDADNIVRSLVYENDNNTLVENSRITLQGAQSGSLDWGDFDNDGDLDLLLTGGDPSGNPFTHLYRNRPESQDFALNIANVQNLPQLNNSTGAWGDFDNDGDLDLILMGTAPGQRITALYRNDKSTFSEDGSQTLIPTDNGDLAWGDVDNDGDLDLATIGQISDANDAALSLYLNNPVGTLSPDTRSTFNGLLASSLAWGDFDNDGDLDLGTTGFNFTEGLLTRLYENDGSGQFTIAGANLIGVAASDLAWGDFDNDGDLDLALVGQAASGQILHLFRNQSDTFEQVTIDILVGIDFAAVTWADIDNDGDLDLASSGRTSVDPTTFPPVTRINDNLESRFNPNRNPEVPQGINATSEGNAATLSWFASSDLGITPDVALTYALRMGTTPGGNEILSGISPPGAGPVRKTTYRLRNLESGRYFWSVRAIDHGQASSAFSEEASFIVDTVKPIIDSIRVRPRNLRRGRRATVVINFQDEPAGMDNAVPPGVRLQIPGAPEGLIVNQVSYSGGLWIGETADIDIPTPGGTAIVTVEGAKDLKNNEMVPFKKAIPALIGPGSGGVVQSLDGVVTLTVFPSSLPTSITDNPDIAISSRPVDNPPSGATAVGRAYEVTATPSITLRKAVTLTFELDSANASRLAVYQQNGASWARIGGTVESNPPQIKAAVDQLGTFALFEETTIPAGTAGISNLTFSNRAFSPGANALRPQIRERPPGSPLPPATNPLLTTTDISFDLGAQATVRIEIYNRTGRLQRVLETGRTLGPGRHVITWDGRDGNNTIVKSGLYIVVIDANGQKVHKTVAIVNN